MMMIMMMMTMTVKIIRIIDNDNDVNNHKNSLFISSHLEHMFVVLVNLDFIVPVRQPAVTQ